MSVGRPRAVERLESLLTFLARDPAVAVRKLMRCDEHRVRCGLSKGCLSKGEGSRRMAESDEFDVAVVGAGIVGLATSVALTDRWPTLRVVVLEKETSLGAHQTGRNSGVVHSGIYYKPGSFKARLCRAGNESIVRFCGDHGLPYERCGKLIVASDEGELARLDNLSDRARASDIPASVVSREEISEREPAVAGVGGLWIPSTGITDYKAILECWPSSPENGTERSCSAPRSTTSAARGNQHVLQTSRGRSVLVFSSTVRGFRATGWRSVPEHRCRPGSFPSGASTTSSHRIVAISSEASSIRCPIPTSPSSGCTSPG